MKTWFKAVLFAIQFVLVLYVVRRLFGIFVACAAMTILVCVFTAIRLAVGKPLKRVCIGLYKATHFYHALPAVMRPGQ